MSIEREIKLDAPEGFVLPGLAGALDGVDVHPREVERFTTVYVDTEDLRLARWGCSLRHRTGQGWTLKLPPVSDPGDDASDEALHRGGIKAKRARYEAESMAPVFGKSARAFARASRHLQDLLGEHHDAVATEAWLREVAGKAGSRQAFVAGQLAAMERRAAEMAGSSWPAAWSTLDRKRLRFWA